jgi:hypothetical protein
MAHRVREPQGTGGSLRAVSERSDATGNARPASVILIEQSGTKHETPQFGGHLIIAGSVGAPASKQVMRSEREPPLGQMVGSGQPAAGELFDFPDAVAQRLLVDMPLRGGQLP